MTNEELDIITHFGLELSDSYLRIILKSAGIRSFENLTDDEIHKLCIERISEYIKDVVGTAEYIKKENI